MTTIETWMKRFNAEASPCKAHGVRPVYSYDGIHSIECGSGCVMIDAENATLMKIMERWELHNTATLARAAKGVDPATD